MGNVTEKLLSISTVELWEAVDPVKRKWVADFLEKILLLLFDKELINNQELQAFLFDSILLHYLLRNKNESKSYLFKSTLFPLIIQSGKINDFFTHSQNTSAKLVELIEKLHHIFSIGPLDVDIKIPQLNHRHLQAIIEFISQESEQANQDKVYLFYGGELFNELPVISFDKLTSTQIEDGSIGALKIFYLENVDQKERESDPLNVIVIEIGYVEKNNPGLDNFRPFASFHMSNVPKFDDRLRANPNSNLTKILGEILIENRQVSIQFPPNHREIMYEELELFLDDSDPIGSFIASISAIRKIAGISHKFGTNILSSFLKKLEWHAIQNPFFKIHQQLENFLAKNNNQIKITKQFDQERFSGDMAIIAMSLGLRNFFIFLKNAGLVDFLNADLKKLINNYNETNSDSSGFFYANVSISSKNLPGGEVSILFFPSLNSLRHDPHWNGISSILIFLNQNNFINEKHLEHPLQTFIELFCKPFFAD